MYRQLTYCLFALSLIFSGCKPYKKKIDWTVNLGHENKNPYGSYIAYQSLKYSFPGAKIDALSGGFRYSNIDYKMKYDPNGTSLLILTGLHFYISDDELNQLISFAEAGNEVLLFCSYMDYKLEEKLKCSRERPASRNSNEEEALNQYNNGDLNKNCLSLETDNKVTYGYKGRTIQGWLETHDATDNNVIDSAEAGIQQLLDAATAESADSPRASLEDDPGVAALNDTVTAVVDEYTEPKYEDDNAEKESYGSPEVLGRVSGKPDILRYEVGRGHITIHAAPLVMSNYFLLQENNSRYLAGLWNTLPDDITHVYWNSYFKHRAEHSDFGILWRHPATRWALWLSIIALVLYVLLELKRRQNPIPIVPPLINSSVSFVETVGRLYYNKGNHRNLAEKMTQHFLEWVRIHYYLNTNQLNDSFIQSLANKSGLPIEVAGNIIEMIHEIRLGSIPIDEPYLYHLNNTIQRFYKNHNK